MAAHDLRLENDVRAFKAIDPILTFRAWGVLRGFGLFDSLAKGANLETLANQANLKNKKMLSCLLGFLVGKNVLKFENSLFSFANSPRFPSSDDFLFLYTNYAHSMLWVDSVTSLAPGVLASGKPISEMGFGKKGDLDLWDAVMSGSPYSFRQFLIDKVLTNKKNLRILDFGCGGGVGIEQLLKSVSVPISIMGVDSSEFYLQRAKNRVENLRKLNNSNIALTQSNVHFAVYDYLKDKPLVQKFDVIYLSLVLNHLSYPEQQKLIPLLKSYLNDSGVLAIYQIINVGPLDRNPLCWVMHVVPSHKCYPESVTYLSLLKENFNYVDDFFGGIIVIAKK